MSSSHSVCGKSPSRQERVSKMAVLTLRPCCLTSMHSYKCFRLPNGGEGRQTVFRWATCLYALSKRSFSRLSVPTAIAYTNNYHTYLVPKTRLYISTCIDYSTIPKRPTVRRLVTLHRRTLCLAKPQSCRLLALLLSAKPPIWPPECYQPEFQLPPVRTRKCSSTLR